MCVWGVWGVCGGVWVCVCVCVWRGCVCDVSNVSLTRKVQQPCYKDCLFVFTRCTSKNVNTWCELKYTRESMFCFPFHFCSPLFPYLLLPLLKITVCENLTPRIVCGNKHTHTASHSVSNRLTEKSVVQGGGCVCGVCGGWGGGGCVCVCVCVWRGCVCDVSNVSLTRKVQQPCYKDCLFVFTRCTSKNVNTWCELKYTRESMFCFPFHFCSPLFPYLLLPLFLYFSFPFSVLFPFLSCLIFPFPSFALLFLFSFPISLSLPFFFPSLFSPSCQFPPKCPRAGDATRPSHSTLITPLDLI